MSEDTIPTKKCPVCRGRGYIHCDCWPGDCICGVDDEPCEACASTGWVWDEPDEPDFDLLREDRDERARLEKEDDPT